MINYVRIPLIVLGLVTGCVLALSANAAASSIATGPNAKVIYSEQPSDLRHLVQTLQDPDQRERLINQIEALIAIQDHNRQTTQAAAANASKPLALGTEIIKLLSEHAKSLGMIASTVASAHLLSNLAQWFDRIATGPDLRFLWLAGAGTVVAVLGVARGAELGAEAVLGRVGRRLRASTAAPAWLNVAELLADVLLRWLSILVFLCVGYLSLAVALAITGPQDTARLCVLAVLHARVFVQSILVATAAVFERAIVGLGRFHVDNETANYWLVWIGRLTRFSLYSSYALGLALNIGMTEAIYVTSIKILGLTFAGLVVMLLLQNRHAIAHFIRGSESAHGPSALRGLRGRIAEIWHLAAIVYIAGAYGIWAAEIPGGLAFLARSSILSTIVLVMARFGAIGGTRLANRLLAISPDLARRLPDLQHRVNLYSPVLIRIGCGLVYIVAGLLVLQIWNVDIAAWLTSPHSLRLVSSVAVVALTLVLAMVTWEAVGLAIHLYLGTSNGARGSTERSARARTLLPLFRNTLAFILSAVVGLVVLSELGINIGPLLAGAGIAGIAIGFGAQTLVKDVITGLFILMQDAVAVGDVVTVAGNSGLVEHISIRSIRLRSLDGTVIIVPFSEVNTVRNMTKDFSYALFDIGVSYREDVDRVIGVIAALANELYDDQEYQWRILEPIEVLGLDQFSDSAVVIKARIKTKPIQQWTVMREFNRRLKRRFDELGIEIPYPHRTVVFGAEKKGGATFADLVASSIGRGRWGQPFGSADRSASYKA